MDRESGEKVITQNRTSRHRNGDGTEQSPKKGYVLWTFTVIAMLLLLFVCGMSHAGNIREKQRQELIAIHPELQQELQDNFTYYQGQVARLAWIALAVLIILILLFGAILLWLKSKE